MRLVPFAGCDSTPLPGETVDGDGLPPKVVVDLAMKPTGSVDFDLPPPIAAQTGDPCRSNSDCSPSLGPGNNKPTCIKSTTVDGNPVVWMDGYCESPCRLSRSDPQGINPDCPSPSGVCEPTSQTTGVCVRGCESFADCRQGYVCALDTGTPTGACVPLALSKCDPPSDPEPRHASCPNGQRCVSYSPDNSFGNCATVCDPLKQDCPPLPQGATGCIVDLQSKDGSGICLNVRTPGGAADCHFLTDCAAGYMCVGAVCRRYCRTGGSPCPQGQSCHDINLVGVMIQFTAAMTGICE